MVLDLVINIPSLPISLNKMLFAKGNSVIWRCTKDAYFFKMMVAQLLSDLHITKEYQDFVASKNRIGIRVILDLPSKRDKTRDLDNFLHCLLDSLSQDKILFENAALSYISVESSDVMVTGIDKLVFPCKVILSRCADDNDCLLLQSCTESVKPLIAFEFSLSKSLHINNLWKTCRKKNSRRMKWVCSQELMLFRGEIKNHLEPKLLNMKCINQNARVKILLPSQKLDMKGSSDWFKIILDVLVHCKVISDDSNKILKKIIMEARTNLDGEGVCLVY